MAAVYGPPAPHRPDVDTEGPLQLLARANGAARLQAGQRALTRLLGKLRGKGLSAHDVVLVLESAMRQAEYDRNHRTRNKKP